MLLLFIFIIRRTATLAFHSATDLNTITASDVILEKFSTQSIPVMSFERSSFYVSYCDLCMSISVVVFLLPFQDILKINHPNKDD